MENATKTEIATPEVRAQLAQDVLDQLEAGELSGVPIHHWFIGFPLSEAALLYKEVHLDIDDFSDGNTSSYCGDDDEKDNDEYWTIGSRGTQGVSSQPYPLNEMDLQEVLKKFKVCEVCAVGSLVVAAAKRFDNMKLSELESAGVFAAMAPYFSKDQLLTIETAYEREWVAGSPADAKPAADLWPSTRAGTARLKLIMQNIVKNLGVFVIE